MTSGSGWVQDYNGQAVVAEDGLILAAELTQSPIDVHQLVPMVEATKANLRTAGFRRRIGTLVADAGYWSETNLATVEAVGRTRLLIAPKPSPARRPGSSWVTLPGRERMRRRLSPARYNRRSVIVEQVFGQIKEIRGIRRFRRRASRPVRANGASSAPPTTS